VWHAGVSAPPPADAAHHNIHFGTLWDDAFRAILRDGTRMPDPSILVTVPTIDDPTLAPDGCSVLYVLEPTPNLDGAVDWSTERHRARDEIAAKVAALGYGDASSLEVEAFVDPTDWAAAGMERGTPFALSHRFFQTGPFRPNNVDRRAPGLVFTGSGTLPGVGVPMVLVSGRLAADRVDELAG
jgi:phytoene desaturase